MDVDPGPVPTVAFVDPVDRDRFTFGPLIIIRPPWWSRLWRRLAWWRRSYPVRVVKVDRDNGVITVERP